MPHRRTARLAAGWLAVAAAPLLLATTRGAVTATGAALLLAGVGLLCGPGLAAALDRLAPQNDRTPTPRAGEHRGVGVTDHYQKAGYPMTDPNATNRAAR